MPRLPALLAAFAACGAAAQDPAALPGIRRAAASPIAWAARDSTHPILGKVRVAHTRRPVETAVGASTIYSRVLFSCAKPGRTFAIELANVAAPADPIGLQPASEPRLVCNRPPAPGETALVPEALLATWEVNQKLGDVMTRGLRAFPLRECVSIGVVQEVLLPEGWSQKSAVVQFEILPYDRVLDSIFVACGEPSAYGPESAPAPVAAIEAKGNVASAAASEPQWRNARVLASGKTNVRAGPGLDSAIVTQLAPGSAVQVQRAQGEWWRARSAKGTAFDGYVREDRLSFP